MRQELYDSSIELIKEARERFEDMGLADKAKDASRNLMLARIYDITVNFEDDPNITEDPYPHELV